MVHCSFCGSTILFGGSQEGAPRFCNASCRKKSALIRLTDQLSAEFREENAQISPRAVAMSSAPSQGPRINHVFGVSDPAPFAGVRPCTALEIGVSRKCRCRENPRS